MKKNKYMSGFFAASLAIASLFVGACEDEPDKYEVAGGVPTVKYVRVPNLAVRDSLLSGAYMANTICLVGENLRSVYELYFNDQKAILNSSYITEHTLLVDVPKKIPSVVTNKIYMITKSKDTIHYDFKVLVPGPAINGMKCEWARPGELAEIRGDYFINDANKPLTLKIGEKNIDLVSFTQNRISFVVPENLTSSPLEVTTIYGTTKSRFYYMDTRGMLFDDWGAGEGGTGLTNHGWHAREMKKDDYSLNGSYMELGGATMSPDGGWADSNFAFEYWPGDWNTPQGFTGTDIRLSDLVSFKDFKNMSLKFEMCIPASNPWMAGAMQIIFSGNDQVTMQTANNTFFNNDTGYPRALYRPWISTGSYDTADGWVTVTLPIADSFVYDQKGEKAKIALTEDHFTGLTIFVWGGGISGTECNPIIKIDNIRAVPN